MAVTITMDNVNESLDWLVETYGPDYVYERVPGEGENGRCRYVHEGQGSCLVGKMFIRLGVDVEDMAAQEGRGAPTVLAALQQEGLVQYGETPVDMARIEHLLCVAQMCQDTGKPWGEALQRARANVAECIEEGTL